MPRFQAHCAGFEYPALACTVYDGFAPMEGETYPSVELARARADYLNRRAAEKAAA